jgi:hypothetical protein
LALTLVFRPEPPRLPGPKADAPADGAPKKAQEEHHTFRFLAMMPRAIWQGRVDQLINKNRSRAGSGFFLGSDTSRGQSAINLYLFISASVAPFSTDAVSSFFQTKKTGSLRRQPRDQIERRRALRAEGQDSLDDLHERLELEFPPDGQMRRVSRERSATRSVERTSPQSAGGQHPARPPGRIRKNTAGLNLEARFRTIPPARNSRERTRRRRPPGSGSCHSLRPGLQISIGHCATNVRRSRFVN